jgi:hypothetical protein
VITAVVAATTAKAEGQVAFLRKRDLA